MPVIVSLPDLTATEALAKRIAPLVGIKDVVTLEGDLGAGKTTFVRAMLRELGIEDDVPSPTFTLVQVYETLAFPVYHFDLYRLKHPEEIEEIGFEDTCAHGLVLVEWPERASSFMPQHRLTIRFDIDPENRRRATLEGHGVWQQRLGSFHP